MLGPNQSGRYRAYLLRLWEKQGQPVACHCTLEDPRTGERRAFASLKALVAFLQTEVTGDADLDAQRRPRVQPGDAA